MRRGLRVGMVAGVLLSGCCLQLQAHESPVDPVSRTLTFWVQGDRLRLRYEVQITERSALLELRAMDRNRDGAIQDSERDDFMADKARRLAERLNLSMGSTPMKLTPIGSVALGRGWRQTFEFEATFSNLASGSYNLEFSDRNSWLRPGPFQWTIGRPADLPPKGPSDAGSAVLRAGPSVSPGSTHDEASRIALQLLR